MDAGLETVQLNLLAFHLDVPMQGAEVSSEKVHTGAEVPNRHGSPRVHALHILSEPSRGEDAHKPDQLPIEVVKRKSQHLQVLKGLALQEGLGEKRCVDLLVEHSVREDCRSHLHGALVSWSALQALASDTVVLYSFHGDCPRHAVLEIEACNDLNKAALRVFCLPISRGFFVAEELYITIVAKHVLHLSR